MVTTVDPSDLSLMTFPTNTFTSVLWGCAPGPGPTLNTFLLCASALDSSKMSEWSWVEAEAGEGSWSLPSLFSWLSPQLDSY